MADDRMSYGGRRQGGSGIYSRMVLWSEAEGVVIQQGGCAVWSSRVHPQPFSLILANTHPCVHTRPDHSMKKDKFCPRYTTIEQLKVAMWLVRKHEKAWERKSLGRWEGSYRSNKEWWWMCACVQHLCRTNSEATILTASWVFQNVVKLSSCWQSLQVTETADSSLEQSLDNATSQEIKVTRRGQWRVSTWEASWITLVLKVKCVVEGSAAINGPDSFWEVADESRTSE